jgi:sec-independent protein translocase protein TatA
MGISVTKLLIVLAIIVVIFGTKRLKNVGADLGGAIKSFRSSLREEEDKDKDKDAAKNDDDKPIDGEVTSKKDDKA